MIDIDERLIAGRFDAISRENRPTTAARRCRRCSSARSCRRSSRPSSAIACAWSRPRPIRSRGLERRRGDAPAAREFRIAGIFYSGFDEYDRRLAYVSLPDAQAFYTGAGDVVTGVELQARRRSIRRRRSRKICCRDLGGTPYRVIDWEELNHNLFTALRMQKVALVIFLTLIILVAAFNIVAAMTMLVIDKPEAIAILKSMGMRSAGVGARVPGRRPDHRQHRHERRGRAGRPAAAWWCGATATTLDPEGLSDRSSCR